MNKLACLVLIMALAACSMKPIQNINNEQIPTYGNGTQPSLKDVEQTILTAAKKRGWSARVAQPGLIEASIFVRSHRAKIEIPYTQNSYSINYKNSANLDYDGEKINRNYNNWIIKLSGTIQSEFGFNVQRYQSNNIIY